jgi:hypothetical protein
MLKPLALYEGQERSYTCLGDSVEDQDFKEAH